MSNIIEFKKPEKAVPHASGEARCMECKHEWVAVIPVEDLVASDGWIECPACEFLKGRMKYAYRPPEGSLVFECYCGNDFFIMMPDMALCPNCGTKHKYPN